jgi:hypothetical protein
VSKNVIAAQQCVKFIVELKSVTIRSPYLLFHCHSIILIRILEALWSNLGWDTGYPD